MESSSVYKDIAARTGGDIYIGVVGPVRTGKSTFVKKFMEELILPRLTGSAVKTRARDELPQSAAGRTIMTTEPKFIPETAVTVELEGGGSFNTRLIDCVGYMVEGAMGHEENEKPRMVKSPWFEEEVPFDVAAETGTRKVIRDHSTIGLVITTDGSISDIPPGKIPGRRSAGHCGTDPDPQTLRHPAQLRGPGQRHRPPACAADGGGIRPHRPAGELCGPGCGGHRPHPAKRPL